MAQRKSTARRPSAPSKPKPSARLASSNAPKKPAKPAAARLTVKSAKSAVPAPASPKNSAKPAPVASASSAASPLPEPLKDAVRVGLCGIGRTGFGRIRNEIGATRHFRVQAGFDLIHDRALQLRDVFGSTAHSSFEELLDDDDVELVVIATRSDTHAGLAIKALQAGKHVVVEKPMATRLADADAMIAVAKKAKGRLFVRHNRRFDPPFVCAREVLASGKLGRLHSVQIRVGEYVRRSDWQTLKRFGGGQLLNWGPHVIDWALQLLGGHAVEQWSDLKLIAAAGDAEDHVKLLLKGPSASDGSGGAVADLEISGANALKQPPFVLAGDRGALTIDGPRAKLRYLRVPPDRNTLLASDSTPGQDDKRYKVDDKSDWIEEEFPAVSSRPTDFWTEIYKTLRKGTDFPVTLDQAREVMRVIEQARVGTPF